MSKHLAALEADYRKVGGFAREIIAKRTAITTVVSVGLGVLYERHIVSLDVSNHVGHYVVIGLGALGSVVSVLWSRGGVTPADLKLNPTSSAGKALVEAKTVATSASAIADAAVAALTAATTTVAS